MAKRIILYVVALFMIFPLFWNHGNAATPRKLGTRYSAVTSLPSIGDATFGGLLGSSRKLGSRSNIITSSLLNTNEATSDESKDRDSPISSSLVHEAPTTTTPRKLRARQFGVTCLKNTNCAISDRSRHLYSSTLSSLAHANVVAPRILGSRHNAVTSLPNANEAQYSPISSSSIQANAIFVPHLDPTIFTDETIDHKSGISENPIIITSLPNIKEASYGGLEDQDSPISSSSTQVNAIIIVPSVNQTIFTNEPLDRMDGTRENPIIVTSLPNTNEEANVGESELYSSPVSSSPTQTNVVLPRKSGSGHGSFIIN